MLDDLVNAWLLDKWLKGEIRYPRYDPMVHGKPQRIKVLNSDAGWDCECYSEYTRCDTEALFATFDTAKGPVSVQYGVWGNLPQMLEELVDFGESECPHDEYEDD